jgi:type IV pilus assembly protein PilV
MKTRLTKIKLIKSQRGAILLEALIAILIFSFGILAISGLQAAMVKNTTEANFRSEASYIAQQEIGRLWSDPSNLGTLIGSPTDISNRLPNGNLAVKSLLNNRVLITVQWQVPGGDQHSFVTSANVNAN